MLDDRVIDIDTLMATFEGDRGLLREVAELFLGDYPMHVENIGQALSSGDAAGVEAAAHTLKGAVSNFAAKTAMDAAANLERMGREGSLAGGEAVLDVLAREMSRVDAAIRVLLDEVTD